MAQLKATEDPVDVATDLLRRRVEAVAFRVQLPPKDLRQKHLNALRQAIGARAFDDGAISLEACLREVEA